MMGWKSLIKDEVITPSVSLRVHYATLVPLKGRQCFLNSYITNKLTKKNCRPLRGCNEAFRGLPEWQAVPSEESTVPCATEDPIGSEMKQGVMERRG